LSNCTHSPSRFPWSFDTGGMQMEGAYRSGVSEGPSKLVIRMKNGSLQTQLGNFVAGKMHGTWTSSNTRGSRSEEVFEHGIKVSGTYWHENGVMSAHYPYRFGKTHGTARQWHPNGQLEREQEYIDGKRHGSSVLWHDNGQKFIETKFAGDKEVGSYWEWSRDGKLVVNWVQVGRDRKYLVSRDSAKASPQPPK
jgi:antitoxin component YwqK of YwqJK toxin-antitoxin module